MKISIKNKIMLFFLSLTVLILFILWCIQRYAPDRYNPFVPLSIQDTPTFVTQYKIRKLKDDADECFEVLEKSELEFEKMLDKETGEGCGFSDAAVLIKSSISYGGDITLTCPALVSLAMWETHHLQDLAQSILGQKIQRIRHYGTYACRNINSAQKGRRSQHASANAIDIAGFRLEDGTEISVLDHWKSDSNKGEFIQEAHQSACSYFTTVLGPQYNDLHKDHFHFDMGSSLICR
jgi:hypothetical protein